MRYNVHNSGCVRSFLSCTEYTTDERNVIMKRRYIFLWYISIGLFIVSLVPFVDFMYHTNFSTMRTLVICISVATLCYVISTKQITYPEGYTAIQAMSFYRRCKKEGISKPEQCRKKTVKMKETALKFEFSKNNTRRILLQ